VDPRPVPPPRRRYAEPARNAPRERDVQRLLHQYGPAAFGFGVGLIWVTWTGALPWYTPALTAVGVWAITQLLVRIAAGVTHQYLGGSGGTTPHRAEYSQPRALAAQGRYREAAEAWEIAAAESEGDPEPYMALARLHRDQLKDPEAAAEWFRRARRDARLDGGLDLLVTQELIELYVKRLRQPQRAVPELARLHGRFPNTPAGQAAERELRELREQIARDRAEPG
jgi:tetratricopeptide (TPR) repeat protein